jgi:hypothetical protein
VIESDSEKRLVKRGVSQAADLGFADEAHQIEVVEAFEGFGKSKHQSVSQVAFGKVQLEDRR